MHPAILLQYRRLHLWHPDCKRRIRISNGFLSTWGKALCDVEVQGIRGVCWSMAITGHGQPKPPGLRTLWFAWEQKLAECAMVKVPADFVTYRLRHYVTRIPTWHTDPLTLGLQSADSRHTICWKTIHCRHLSYVLSALLIITRGVSYLRLQPPAIIMLPSCSPILAPSTFSCITMSSPLPLRQRDKVCTTMILKMLASLWAVLI